jgi:hypothetical protein
MKTEAHIVPSEDTKWVCVYPSIDGHRRPGVLSDSLPGGKVSQSGQPKSAGVEEKPKVEMRGQNTTATELLGFALTIVLVTDDERHPTIWKFREFPVRRSFQSKQLEILI